MTSNTHPNDLYKDGLQRDKFINDMKVIDKYFNVFNLDGSIDYRTRNIINIDSNKNNHKYNNHDITDIVKETIIISTLIKRDLLLILESIAVKHFQVIFYGFHL